MEAAFKTLEVAAKKLNNDAKKFRDSLSALLNHQLEFGTILGDVYMPANMGGRAGGKRGGDDDEGGHGVSMPIRVGWQLPDIPSGCIFSIQSGNDFAIHRDKERSLLPNR